MGTNNSYKQFLEKSFHDNLTPNDLKINLEPTIGNQNEEFVNQFVNQFVNSKLQSNLTSTECINVKEQVNKSQEITIQKLISPTISPTQV